MFINRLASALRRQDWPTVIIEFLLVVLGVLLALQLDNLNEERKDRAVFQHYLEQLQADLESDIQRAEWRIETTRDQDEAATYLLSVIEGTIGEDINHNKLVRAVLAAGYASVDLVNSQTYDELVSTGNLRLFPDSELKRAVVTYYMGQEMGNQFNTLIRSVQMDYRRLTRNLLTAEQFRWARQNYSDSLSDAPPMDMQRFMRLASGNEDLIGVINAMAEVQERVRGDSMDTARYARELIERIDQFGLEQ